LAGCSDSPTSPSDPPPDDDVEETFTGSVPGFGVSQHAFTATRAGQLRARLTWVDKSVDLDLYLTRADCNVYPLQGGCNTLAISDGNSGTLETITRTATSGEQLRFWIDSFSLGDASYMLEVAIE